MMQLETERLIIDSVKEDDKEDYFVNISHDKKVLETFVCRYAETLDEFDFSTYPGRKDLFAIRLKDTECLIGIILFFDKKGGTCEIGYGIGSRYWNCGYATEAVKIFLEYLHREEGIHTVYASFFTGNDASRRVMEKCGLSYSHFSEKELTYLGVERDLTYFVIHLKQRQTNRISGKRAAGILTVLCLVFSISGFSGKAAPVQENNAGTAYRINTGLSSDIARTDVHEDITWDLIMLAEHDPELKRLLEKSILQAAEENPDPDTNPVVSLETYYQFIDRIVRAMPWEISPSGSYSSLYSRIDQGMGCLYFVCDQPLEELSDKEYFHNSLLYHEPFRSWWIKLLSVNGSFLSTEESWNDEYYTEALANPDFGLEDGTYEDPSNWKNFNDFFARKLKDASVRPISEPDNTSVVTSPADSVPQGIWQIDGEGRIKTDIDEQAGISIKTARLTNIHALLADSGYAEKFCGGTITHTFLDITDYHRYHFPVSGTVREVRIIAQDDAPGGVITWDEERGCYYEYYSETLGWQAIETRGIVIVELTGGGYTAIIPVGMCQVSSVNFEDEVTAGANVQKGDPLGFFLFGGSDIIMIFSPEVRFDLTAEPGEHILMGTEYGRLMH